MQRSDGAAYHKIVGEDWGGDIRPEHDTQTRYYAKISSGGTADLVAVAAMAARVYASYDDDFADRCLQAAEAGYAFLQENPDSIRAQDADLLQNHYGSDDGDDRLWAAAEMWESTQDPAVLEDVEARLGEAPSARDAWDWSDVHNLALYTYAFSKHTEPDERDAATLGTVEDALIASADQIADIAETHAYGVGYDRRPYWGINGILVRMTLNIEAAYRLTEEPRYLDVSVMQLDHVLGRNLYGRSFVTGLGHAPPRSPHHRPSQADGVFEPWPGLLVGGPWFRREDGPTSDEEGWQAWKDEPGNFNTNEVAINWTAALIYALAVDYGR